MISQRGLRQFTTLVRAVHVCLYALTLGRENPNIHILQNIICSFSLEQQNLTRFVVHFMEVFSLQAL